MIEVNLKATVNAPCGELWDLLRDFNGLPRFMKAITASSMEGEGVGAVRTLTLPDGLQIQERLEEFDDTGMSLSYSIVSGPLPVANYLAVVRVSDQGGDQAEVSWSSTFEARGASEEQARQAIEGIYQMGFLGIRELFA